MSANTASSNHGMIFSVLVILALCSIATGFMGFAPGLNNLIVLAVAVLMAALVVLQYMGLRLEGALVIWTFLIPVILFAILVIGLLPDIAHTSVDFLKAVLR